MPYLTTFRTIRPNANAPFFGEALAKVNSSPVKAASERLVSAQKRSGFVRSEVLSPNKLTNTLTTDYGTKEAYAGFTTFAAPDLESFNQAREAHNKSLGITSVFTLPKE